MSLSFAHPWLLGGLALLPILWWWLRITPPSPKVVIFPAIRLLLGISPAEETPARTPPWLLVLRMAIAALVITAMAGPGLIPQGSGSAGTLLIVIDNSWAGARSWDAMRDSLKSAVSTPGVTDIRLLPLARPASGRVPEIEGPLSPRQAASAFDALAPHPWPADEAAAIAALDAASLEKPVSILWLSGGVSSGATTALAEKLASMGSGEIHVPGLLPHLLPPPRRENDALLCPIRRAPSSGGEDGFLRAWDENGEVLASAPFSFEAGKGETAARMEIPEGDRNRLARIGISGEPGASAAFLMDGSWRLENVGLVSGQGERTNQPYLSDSLYIERALSPFHSVKRGNITGLVGEGVSALILADVGTLTGAEKVALDAWVNQGGALIRFAGPGLASATDPALLPIAIRNGERLMDGAMSWSKPAHLAPFPEGSPLYGLAVPDDITVARQILAEPSPELSARTWASLSDGTPLITGARMGRGTLVLVHTTARPEWSNIALSGLFVDILRRLTSLGSGGSVSPDPSANLAPLMVMDGFGTLTPPGPENRPLRADGRGAWQPSPSQPPGIYGEGSGAVAINFGDAVADIAPLPALPPAIAVREYASGRKAEIPLAAWLLAAALFLLAADTLISLRLRGLLAILAACALPFGAANAAGRDAALETHIGYVETGNALVDATSKSGLESLARVLAQRTSLDAIKVSAVIPGRDELPFLPLIYWPMTAEQSMPADAAASAVNDYMRNGGLILFDTRDQMGGPGGFALLQELARQLDIPPLVPVPEGHVLHKAFYLLDDFPGRWTGGVVWVAAGESGQHDGTSPVVVGGNDWAAAWASEASGAPSYPVVPGGERQREMAFRFGVNLVMMALTGNYKADQVHLPFILERLKARGGAP